MAKLKLSELTEATSKQNSDLLYIVQSGTSKSITLGNLLANANVQFSTNTTIVTEGANLYFTNARAVAALAAGDNIVIEANGLISSNVDLSGYVLANTLSNIATTGEYDDLANTPTIVTFDQDLNTTDSPNFVNIGLSGSNSTATLATTAANLILAANGYDYRFTEDGDFWIGNQTRIFEQTIRTEPGNSLQLSSGNDLQLYAEQASITLWANSEGDAKVWELAANANMIFPDGTVQSTAYNSSAVVLKTNTTNSNLAIGDDPVNRDNLYIRVVQATPNNALNIQLKYSNPSVNTRVSAAVNWVLSTPSPSASGGNLWGGSTTLGSNNDTWINLTSTEIDTVGDTVTVIITDHNFQKMYRVTAQARDIPAEAVLGSIYCVIEELQ